MFSLGRKERRADLSVRRLFFWENRENAFVFKEQTGLLFGEKVLNCRHERIHAFETETLSLCSALQSYPYLF
jgi:hypothetical protein